jgi:hypothetical protein
MKDEGGRRQEAGRVTKTSIIIHELPYQVDRRSILPVLPPASCLLPPSSLIPHPSSLSASFILQRHIPGLSDIVGY